MPNGIMAAAPGGGGGGGMVFGVRRTARVPQVSLVKLDADR